MSMVKNLCEKYHELIMYFFVGVATTLVSWVAFAFFQWVLPKSGSEDMKLIWMGMANALSWVIAVAFAYITNKILVFRSMDWSFKFVLKEATAFVSSRIVTGIFEIVAQPALYKIGLNQEIFGVDGLPAKIIVSAVVMVLNYLFSKIFVFREKR